MLSTDTWPPWPSTIALTIERPSPVPWIAASIAASVRKKRVKSSRWAPAEIPIPVSATSSTTSARRDGDRDLALVGRRQRALDRLLGELGQVERLPVERHVPGSSLGHEEQVDDDVEQPLRVAADDAEEVAVTLREPVAVLVEQLEVAEDRRQRGPQLVGDDRDQVVLEVVELAQALVLHGQDGAGLVRLLEQLAVLLAADVDGSV